MVNMNYRQTKAEVGAQQECTDLCDNGYLLVSQGKTLNGSYCILRHRSNGRRLIIIVRDGGYVVRENGITLKNVDFDEP